MRTVCVLTAVTVMLACVAGDESESGPELRMSLVETLGGADTLGFERAIEPREFVFPADHGPHPRFRTEWWYVTGNLETAEGRPFGFQFTIFRSSLSPNPPDLMSQWATNQAFMGHFTVTDAEGERFLAFERFSRGGAGLAGARAEPFRVWLEEWELAGGVDDAFPIALSARESRVDLSLRLQAGKPPTFQGDAGLSQKGSEVGNASYYYSHTRLPASGTLALDGDSFTVSGDAWLDREWSTSALSEGQVGWDWFALQLDDGWEVMVYQLRLADGSPDLSSDGVLIDPTGRKIRLEWGRELTVEATGEWRSPIDGARYPAGWRILIPERGWDLRIDPLIADQELDLAFRYWEGAVRATGVGESGAPVEGRGYVELTGYAGGVPAR